ncbi:MAG: hypothetical protein AAGI01_15115, partial [Myxococcota bacterium]
PMGFYRDLADEVREALGAEDTGALPTHPMVEDVEDAEVETAPMLEATWPPNKEARTTSTLRDEPDPEPEPQHIEEPAAPTTPERIPCVRSHSGLAPVGLAEFMVALVTPITLALGVLTYSWLYGPLERTAPGMWLAYAALVWLTFAPLALRWRMAWRGTLFAVVRRATLEDHTEVVCARGGTHVGPQVFPDAELTEVSRARWSSRRDGREGASLQLVWSGEVHVFTAEDEELWSEESLPTGPEPERAWRVAPGDLEALHTHTERTLVDIQ